jgi:hypothetical protein
MEPNFFPRESTGSSVRVPMLIAEDEFQRGSRSRFKVTDKLTGKSYTVRNASCGFPGCLCDAVIVKEN